MPDFDTPGAAPEEVLTPEQGLHAILQATRVFETVQAPLCDAYGLVVAEEIRSAQDLPPFANSAMDGFAVRSADTLGAAPEAPRELRIIGRAPAGAPFEGVVGAGEAVEIMTGAPVPEGADAVVRVEDTSFGRAGWASHPHAPSNGNGSARKSHVAIFAEVSPGTAVRAAGADKKEGALIAEAGAVVTPGLLGLVASCGIAAIPVHRPPTIALCVTGDELQPVGKGLQLKPGQIFDSNSPMLLSLLRSWGAHVDFLGRLPDDPDAMRETLERGLQYDYFVSVGGVSMGRYDYVRHCLAELGAEEIFWKLNQQPGGPLLFARRGETLIFGLPGNPVSCYFCAELYLQSSLRRATAQPVIAPPVAQAQLLQPLQKRHGKTAFLRARLGTFSSGSKRHLIVSTTGAQDSNIVSSITSHHGYIVFPAPLRELAAGSTVEVLVTDLPTLARYAADLLIPPAEKSL